MFFGVEIIGWLWAFFIYDVFVGFDSCCVVIIICSDISKSEYLAVVFIIVLVEGMYLMKCFVIIFMLNEYLG